MVSTTANYTKLIELDSQGRAVVKGTRYRVAFLAAEHTGYRWSAKELQENHPDLSVEQIDAALAYFYDHRVNIEKDIAANDRDWVEGRAKSTQSTRDELKARLA